MNRPTDGRWKALAVVVAVCVGLVAGGVAVHGFLALEASHARAFVEEGQRALARGDRGGAVLALERARWFAPRSEEVRSALAATGVKDAEAVLPRTLRLVTLPEWSAIAIVAGWVSGLGIAFAVAWRPRRHAGWASVSAGVVFLVAMAANMQTATASLAVVTATDANLLVAPYATGGVKKSLGNGTVVVVGSHYGDFAHVDDSSGTAGWAPRSSIASIASP